MSKEAVDSAGNDESQEDMIIFKAFSKVKIQVWNHTILKIKNIQKSKHMKTISFSSCLYNNNNSSCLIISFVFAHDSMQYFFLNYANLFNHLD